MRDDALILLVDDQPDNLLILDDLLGGQYRVRTALDGREAMAFLVGSDLPDLVLTDVVMPDMDGFEVCRRMKADARTRDIPVLFLTSLESAADEAYGLSIGAEDFIHKPFSAPVVLARVRTHLQLARARSMLADRNHDLERMVDERTRQIRLQADELMHSKQQLIAAQGATISAFCSLAEARDNETGNHIRRTQNYVRLLAERLRDHPRFRATLSDEVIQMLYKSAPLHDVGKVAIPDAILLKPGKLTEEEWSVMKRHCEYGRDAILQAEREMGDDGDDYLAYAREIAYSHHERWDGSGYPEGLAGDAIPISARLMAVADVYDALISRRVYKPAYSCEEAVSLIVRERGSHFDPDIVDVMIDDAEAFHAIARQYRDPC